MSHLQTWFGRRAISSGPGLAGWVRWRRRSRARRPGQQPVHRRDRAQVAAFVEQAGPHLGRGQIAVPGERSSARTCWRSASLRALGGVAAGACGPAAGGRRRR